MLNNNLIPKVNDFHYGLTKTKIESINPESLNPKIYYKRNLVSYNSFFTFNDTLNGSNGSVSNVNINLIKQVNGFNIVDFRNQYFSSVNRVNIDLSSIFGNDFSVFMVFSSNPIIQGFNQAVFDLATNSLSDRIRHYEDISGTTHVAFYTSGEPTFSVVNPNPSQSETYKFLAITYDNTLKKLTLYSKGNIISSINTNPSFTNPGFTNCSRWTMISGNKGTFSGATNFYPINYYLEGCAFDFVLDKQTINGLVKFEAETFNYNPLYF